MASKIEMKYISPCLFISKIKKPSTAVLSLLIDTIDGIP